MDPHKPPPSKHAQDEMRDLARRNDQSFVGELFDYMLDHRKWWLTPILICLLALAALIALAATGAAPFIYTLF